MSNRTKLTISIVLNAALVVMELFALFRYTIAEGWGLFIWYTNDSNLFALLVSLLYVCAGVQVLLSPYISMGAATRTLRLAAVTSLMLTFFVVLFYLAPAKGPGGYHSMMFSGSGLYLHTICPLLSLLSFVCCEDGPRIRLASAAKAVIPTVLYAAVLIPLNIFRLADGPYKFLRIYENTVTESVLWVVACVGGAYIMALLLRKANNAIHQKRI